MAPTDLRFDQIVFSGGGLRCFWQGGFMDVVRPHLASGTERFCGVSGGALACAAFLSHAGHQLLDAMCRRFSGQPSNLSWNEDEGAGITPHQRIYREVVEEVIGPEAEARIADGPAFQVQIARPPSASFPKASGLAAIAAYEAEMHLTDSPHFSWAERFGLRVELVDARAAARAGQVCSLICAAATIPPIFEPPLWGDGPVIDGGMADQAPMPNPDSGPTLVLLTRDYGKLPTVDGRTYVWPGTETEADKIDFTDPDKLTRTWDQGQREGEQFLITHT